MQFSQKSYMEKIQNGKKFANHELQDHAANLSKGRKLNKRQRGKDRSYWEQGETFNIDLK